MRAACQLTWDKPLLLVPTNWTAQARPRTRMDLRHATVWVASVLRMLRCAQGQEAGARVLHAISHGTTPCCLAPPARQHVTPSERAQPCGVPHCRGGGEPCCVGCVEPGGRLQACSAWMQVHEAPLGRPSGEQLMVAEQVTGRGAGPAIPHLGARAPVASPGSSAETTLASSAASATSGSWTALPLLALNGIMRHMMRHLRIA